MNLLETTFCCLISKVTAVVNITVFIGQSSSTSKNTLRRLKRKHCYISLMLIVQGINIGTWMALSFSRETKRKLLNSLNRVAKCSHNAVAGSNYFILLSQNLSTRPEPFYPPVIIELFFKIGTLRTRLIP